MSCPHSEISNGVYWISVVCVVFEKIEENGRSEIACSVIIVHKCMYFHTIICLNLPSAHCERQFFRPFYCHQVVTGWDLIKMHISALSGFTAKVSIFSNQRISNINFFRYGQYLDNYKNGFEKDFHQHWLNICDFENYHFG